MPAMIPAAHPLIGEEEVDAVCRVLRSRMLAQGKEVAAFENEFSAQLAGGASAVAVNSGTSALHLGLLASGIGVGDEVIVPSFTFAATGNAVALAGATPVFADIDLDTFCLSPASVENAITERTKAIMPVHLYGHPAPMNELKALADKYSLMLFEDAAQAHGAQLDGQFVGTFGAFGAFSFYPTKNMTSGEGGMVTTTDQTIARNVRLLRNQGMEQRYANELIGLNNRMTDIHAAIGRVQLTKVGQWTKQRQAHATFFDTHLEGVIVPRVAEGATHVYHQYTIRLIDTDRDRFMKALAEEWGVGSGVYYPIPNHRLESLKPYAPSTELDNTLRAAREVLSLPVYPSLTDQQRERIVEAVNTLARAGA